MVFTLCVALSQALAAASVECVTVTPTAQAERASAVGTWMAVSVLREGFAVGMDTANATTASAWMATMVPCVISAQAARHHVKDTGEASGSCILRGGAWWDLMSRCHLPALSCMWWVTMVQLVTHWSPLDRDCAECGAFGTGPLATNCSMACAHANVTLTLALASVLDDGWCKERTMDNQLFFFLVEDEAGGKVVLTVRPQESKWAGMLWTCQTEHWNFDR